MNWDVCPQGKVCVQGVVINAFTYLNKRKMQDWVIKGKKIILFIYLF